MNNQATDFNDTHEWQMMGARHQCLQNAMQVCGREATTEDIIKAAEKFMAFISP